jgi:O-antigen/teichoic acid export membrane protein
MQTTTVASVSNQETVTHVAANQARDFSTLLTGASLVLAGSIVSRGLEFVTRAVVARYLGPGQFGILSVAIGILSITGTIVLFGLPSGLVRFIGQYQDSEKDSITGLVRTALWFVTLVSIGLALAGHYFDEWLATILLGNSSQIIVIHYVALSLPFFVILSILSAILQALKDAQGYVVINSFVLPGVRFIGIVAAGLLGWGLTRILGLYLWGALIVAVIVALIMIRQHAIKLISWPEGCVKDLKSLLQFSTPLLIGTLLGLTVWQVDVIMLQHFWGPEQAGLYSGALMIGRLPNMVLLAFGFMIAPFISQMHSQGRYQEMQTLYGRTVDLIFTVGLPVSVAFAAFAPLILATFLGTQYLQAANVLRVIAIGYFLHSILGPNGNALIMIGRSKLYLLDTLITAFLSLILYNLLIPIYGVLGTALATLAGLSLMNCIFAIQLFRITRINPLPWFRVRLLAIVGLATVVGAILERQLNQLLSDWLLLGIVLGLFAITYMSLALATRTIRLSEIRSLRSLLVRKS